MLWKWLILLPHIEQWIKYQFEQHDSIHESSKIYVHMATGLFKKNIYIYDIIEDLHEGLAL